MITLLRAAMAMCLLVAAITIAHAAVDCTKIQARFCTISTGGPTIKGDAGSVPAGSTVTVTDESGHSATTTAARDGSFALNASGTDLVMPVGTTLTIKAGESSCTVEVKKCYEPKEGELEQH